MTEHLPPLPPVVAGFLTAQGARDTAAALTAFTPDAVVTDDGTAHRGPAEIARWLDATTAEYSWSSWITGTEHLGAGSPGTERWTSTHHLEGDFPGGVVDLTHRWTLCSGRIAELTIAP